MLESALVEKIRRAMAARGCWTDKTHGSAFKGGVPDILACYRGLFIALEVKVDRTDKPTKLQQDTIDRINRAGGIATCVYSVEEALNVLDIAEGRRGDE